MIPESELEYKTDEISVIRKDIEELESIASCALTVDDETTAKDAVRKKDVLLIYLRDLMNETEVLRRMVAEEAIDETDGQEGKNQEHVVSEEGTGPRGIEQKEEGSGIS